MKIFKTLSKRGLALFLVLTMCVSLLPATALAEEYVEANHTHNEDGWTCEEGSKLICGYEQEHTHNESCWTTGEKTLVCPLEESEGHRHSEACYDAAGALICGAEEAEGHTHGEACFAAGEKTLVCQLEEHQHSEACYKSAWTCVPPTADVTRFLQAVKAIPAVITSENVEEAEAKIAQAIEAYQHLGGAEKANASVGRGYDAILTAEIAVEAAKNAAEAAANFLRAVQEIPAVITKENAEEAEARIGLAKAAYAQLSEAGKADAAVADACKALADAESALETAKAGTTVIPENAVVVDPALLVAYNYGFEEEELLVADLFTFVANTYLVDEEDPNEVSFPTKLYFAGENVEEQFDIMDVLFPAEDEDALAEEPETVALTTNAITYQGIPVTVYFIPEETATQDELLEEMGNDEVELLLNREYSVKVGGTITLTGNGNKSKDHSWIQNGTGEVTFSTTDSSTVTITGVKPGTVYITHTYGQKKPQSESTTVTVTSSLPTITFDANGGYGTAPSSITVPSEGAEITLPDANGMTREGYVFAGWSADQYATKLTGGDSNDTSAHCMSSIYPAGAGQVFLEDTTLYAVWAEENVTAEFFIYVGTGQTPKEPQDKLDSTSGVYTSGILVKDALKEAVFTYNPAGLDSSYFNSLPSNEDIATKLSAKGVQFDPETQYILWYVIKNGRNTYWHVDGVLKDKTKVELTYAPNAPTNDVKKMPNGQSYVKDATVTVSSNIPERTGYRFLGWNTAADGTGTHYEANNTFTITVNTTLFAQWEPKNSYSYTVDYYLKGTTTALAPQKKVGNQAFNQPVTETAIPIAGYTVDGNSSQTITIAETGNSIVFYYTANEAKIVFHENGGSNVEDMIGVTGQKITATSMPTTTKVGYEFGGWYDNESLTGNAITQLPDAYPAGTTNYWAQWSEKAPEIEVTKTSVLPDGKTVVNTGDIITYTVTITPAATGGLVKNVEITDAKLDFSSTIAGVTAGVTVDGETAVYKDNVAPSTANGVTTFELAEATDKVIVVTYTYKVQADDVKAGEVTNTAAVKAWNTDPKVPGNGFAEDEVPAGAPHLVVTKVVETVTRGSETVYGRATSVDDTTGACLPYNGKLKVGDKITWTIRVTNTDGTATAYGLSVSDVLMINGTDSTRGPASLTTGTGTEKVDVEANYQFDLDVGTDKTFTATYTVKDTDKGTNIANKAVVADPNHEQQPDPGVAPGNDVADREVSIVKSVDRKVGETFERITSETVVAAGDELKYTIEVTNNGGETETDVSVK